MYYKYERTPSVKKRRKNGWRNIPVTLAMTLLVGCSSQFEISNNMIYKIDGSQRPAFQADVRQGRSRGRSVSASTSRISRQGHAVRRQTRHERAYSYSDLSNEDGYMEDYADQKAIEEITTLSDPVAFWREVGAMRKNYKRKLRIWSQGLRKSQDDTNAAIGEVQEIVKRALKCECRNDDADRVIELASALTEIIKQMNVL